MQIGFLDEIARFSAAGEQVVILSETPFLKFEPPRQLDKNLMPARGALQRLISDETGQSRFFDPLHLSLARATRVVYRLDLF